MACGVGGREAICERKTGFFNRLARPFQLSWDCSSATFAGLAQAQAVLQRSGVRFAALDAGAGSCLRTGPE